MINSGNNGRRKGDKRQWLTKQPKKTSTAKSSEKKIATGSTKRIVQSRSSSTAGKEYY